MSHTVQLPADSASITLDWRLSSPWWDDTYDCWDIVPVVIEDQCERGETLNEIGEIHIASISPGRTKDIVGRLDRDGADVGGVAGTILTPGTDLLADDLNAALTRRTGRVLILNTVQLWDEWCGFGLGVRLAGAALRRLSAGARAVAFAMAPADPAGWDPENPEQAGRDITVAKIDALAQGVGFEHYRNGVHILDLGARSIDDILDRLGEPVSVRSGVQADEIA
jgi:hypothetical protein